MLSQKVFAQRRDALLEQLPINSAAILFSAPLKSRNSDVHYPYRQDSNFYYLTGFNEPLAVAILIKSEDGNYNYILFCQERNPEKEIWDGPLIGLDKAKKVFKADKAYSYLELSTKLPEIISGKEAIYSLLTENSSNDEHILKALKISMQSIRKGDTYPKRMEFLQPLLSELRLIKSEHEQKLIRQAAKVSAEAHKEVMRLVKPGLTEARVQAHLQYYFANNNCRHVAYESIVAAGENSCILHYVANNGELKDGDLLLIDAGCEYENYAADITRTIPINGKFSTEQKSIYELVLTSQLAAIKLAKPGITWDKLQEKIVEIISEGLLKLGILQGSKEKIIKDKSYIQYYMHGSGHWLGLDVHDVGAYKKQNKWRKLEAGMVLTIEPGIYIRNGSSADKRWWGIGVRIEDDILITENGCEVLSKDVPKEITEIEALMAK